MKDLKVNTALVNRACIICGKTANSEILIGRRLTKKEDHKITDLHNQTIGFSEKPCEECQKLINQGIVLIGVIKEKTEDINNPYRSGHISVIKEEAFIKIFNQELPKKRIAFVEQEVGEQIGLWKIDN